MVEPDAFMQKFTHFTVSQIDMTKFLWGDLTSHNFLAVGAIAPMESATMVIRCKTSDSEGHTSGLQFTFTRKRLHSLGVQGFNVPHEIDR